MITSMKTMFQGWFRAVLTGVCPYHQRHSGLPAGKTLLLAVILPWIPILPGSAAQEAQSTKTISEPSASPAEWTLAAEVAFDTPDGVAQLNPHFCLNQDRVPYRNPSGYEKWVCPPLPPGVLQLNSSEVNDCFIETVPGGPHRLRWRLLCLAFTNGVTLVPEVNGAVFEFRPKGAGLAVSAEWQWIDIERKGNRVTVHMSDGGEAVTFVNAAATQPLRVTARRQPMVWVRRMQLYIGTGDAWTTPDKATPTATEPEWTEVYRQSFDTAATLQDFAIERTNGIVSWLPEDHCVRLTPDALAEARHQRPQVMARLLQTVHGDVRIRFRARNVPPEDHFFGVLLSCKGPLVPREDGYYCEWNRGWLRRIKKRDIQRAIVHTPYPTDRTVRWIDYWIERVGSRIAMFTGATPVLAWDDPDPIGDPANNQIAFYVDSQELDLDDILIERNTLDIAREQATTRPREEPPITPAITTRATAAADTVIVRQTALGATALEVIPPVIEDVRVEADIIRFAWTSQAGCEYDVEMCNSILGKPQWTPVEGWKGLRGQDGLMSFHAPTSTNGHTFYRVVAHLANP